MTTTVNVNLSGIAFVIDEHAYQVLKNYLDDITSRLAETDRQEVIEDVEARISELLSNKILLTSHQVVTLDILQPILDQIGQPDTFGESTRKVPKSNRPARTIPPLLKVLLIFGMLVCCCPIVLFVCMIVGFVFFVVSAALCVSGVTLWASIGWIIGPMVIAVGMPIFVIIYAVVYALRHNAAPKWRFWLTTGVLWLLSIVALLWFFCKDEHGRSLMYNVTSSSVCPVPSDTDSVCHYEDECVDDEDLWDKNDN